MYGVPETSWNSRGVGFDTVSPHAACFPVKECERIDHPQLFTSQTELDCSNPRTHHNAHLSPWSLGLSDTSISPEPSIGSQSPYQASAQRRMELTPHHIEASYIGGYHDDSKWSHEYSNTPQSVDFEISTSAGSEIHTDNTSATSSLHTVSPDGELLTSHATSSTAAPRPISCDRLVGNSMFYSSGHHADQQNWLPVGIAGQASSKELVQQSRSKGLSSSCAVKPLWQEIPARSQEDQGNHGMSEPEIPPQGEVMCVFEHNGPLKYAYDKSNMNQPSGIADDGAARNRAGSTGASCSSSHYQADLSSSYPPSAGRFPTNRAHMPVSDCSNVSASQLDTNVLGGKSLPMRNKASKCRIPTESSTSSTKPTDECSTIRLGSSPASASRGRRRGRLDPETAFAAGQKRSDGSVCIRCKMMKQQVGPSEVHRNYLNVV